MCDDVRAGESELFCQCFLPLSVECSSLAVLQVSVGVSRCELALCWCGKDAVAREHGPLTLNRRGMKRFLVFFLFLHDDRETIINIMVLLNPVTVVHVQDVTVSLVSRIQRPRQSESSSNLLLYVGCDAALVEKPRKLQPHTLHQLHPDPSTP